MQLRVKEFDDELRLMYVEAYAPVVLPDADTDVMTAEEIRAMAYRWMIFGDNSNVDTMHDREKNGSFVVESFIAREGDPMFITGAWVVVIHVVDVELWEQVKAGDYRGVSLDFSFEYEFVEYEIEIPDVIEGMTENEDGHKHKFYVRLDDNGQLIGGYTDIVNGHMHYIMRGTKTELAHGHEHTYDYIRLISGDGQMILVGEDNNS
ncbi:hypothetical protein [Vibrio phage vB_VhaS-a]|nr:hypothetical protein [Vibrio phage vB_VhaS-a]